MVCDYYYSKFIFIRQEIELNTSLFTYFVTQKVSQLIFQCRKDENIAKICHRKTHEVESKEVLPIIQISFMDSQDQH